MSKDFFPKHARRHRKTLFFRATFSCIFSQFFLLFTPKCDTCDSKKTTLWSECAHLCAPMRTCAHLCVHARNAPSKFSLHVFPHFLFFLIFSSSSFFSASFLIPPHFPLLLFWGIQYLRVCVLLCVYCRFVASQRKKCTFP